MVRFGTFCLIGAAEKNNVFDKNTPTTPTTAMVDGDEKKKSGGLSAGAWALIIVGVVAVAATIIGGGVIATIALRKRLKGAVQKKRMYVNPITGVKRIASRSFGANDFSDDLFT